MCCLIELYAPINVNPAVGGWGGGVRTMGEDLLSKTIPTVGNLTMNGAPGGETFDYGPKLVPRLFPALHRYMRVP